MILVEKENILNPKRYKALGVCIFGHVQQNFPIDPIRCQNDIIFPNHHEVVVDVRNEPVVLNIVIESVKDQDIESLVEEVLSDEIALFILAYDMQS